MRIIKNVDDQFWLDVARKCDYATFFHTPYWHRLAEKTFPHYQDVTLGVELDTGTRAVIPLLETGRVGKGLFRSMVSTFAGCYGGLIADGPLSALLVRFSRPSARYSLLQQSAFRLALPWQFLGDCNRHTLA